MKRIRLPKSFSLNAIFVYVTLFCVTTFAMLENTSVSIGMFSVLKMPLMYLGFICLITQIKTLSRHVFKRRYFFVLLATAVFCILLALTAFANRDATIGESPLHDTLRLMLYLFELFMLMIVLAETGRVRATIHFLFWYLVVLTIANDVLMFTRVLTFGSRKYETYLVGSKFSVAYLHMNLLAVWAVRGRMMNRGRKLPKWAIVLAAAFIVFVALRVDCMTGILGCVALVILFDMVDSPRRHKLLRFTSPNLMLLVMGASLIFVMVADSLMQIPFIQYVVEEVLGRNTSLTGRTHLYNMAFRLFEGNWLDGYGFGNGSVVALELTGYANLQNGILHWLLQVGVPTTLSMIAMMWSVLRQVHRKKLRNMNLILPLVALIYMYILIGTVEITFNMSFIMWFALIFMLVNERQLPNRKQLVENVQ